MAMDDALSSGEAAASPAPAAAQLRFLLRAEALGSARMSRQDLARITDQAIAVLAAQIASSAQRGLNILLGYRADAIRPQQISPETLRVATYLEGAPTQVPESLGVFQLMNPSRVGLAASSASLIQLEDDAFRELIFELRAFSVEVSDGSLISRFLATFAGPGAGLAILLALVGAQADEFQADLKWNARIERSVAGTPCAVDGLAEWRIQQLRQYSPDFFVSDDPILNPADPIRVCVHQYLLELNGFPPGPIDGAWGPRSEAASMAFARKYQVENDRAAYFRILLERLYGPPHES